MAAMMVLVLANPLCACDAQEPQSQSDAPESTGCCSSAETPSAPAPADSSTPGPCDCETAVHEGLLQATKEDFTKPLTLAARVVSPTPFTLLPLDMRPAAFDRADFPEPPVRHRFSVYRL